MGIDVVLILKKMRVDIDGLVITAQGERNDDPPRYFRKIELEFTVTGSVPKARLERAIGLSFEKYCSVFHTLRADLDVGFTLKGTTQ